MSKDTIKDKLFLAKEQNKVLRKELRFYKGKLKDTQESRDYWKSKSKSISSNSTGQSDSLFEGDKAKHHSYSVLLVSFCANIQSYGAMSLRSCTYVLFCLQLSLGTGKRVPSYSSVRVWVCKLGKNRIENQESSTEKWIYWVDESIHIGNEKILLILGIVESQLFFGRSLSLSELKVLHMSVSTQWKGEDIALILNELKQKFPLSYIISDEGNNLKKSYQLSECLHISDCTHALTKGIEKAYKDKSIFIEFCRWSGSVRKKWSLKKDVKPYLPPSQRSKVRFANLFPLIEWAKKQLDNWQNLPAEVEKEFIFLKENEKWLLNFWSIQQKLVEISLILKLEGYTATNELKIKAILGASETEEEHIFSTTVLNYLQNLAKKIEDKKELYCCSDVIESAFGKLKQKLSKSSAALTCFIFTIASIGGHYQTEEVKNALENIKEKDIKKLTKKLKKRTEF